TPVALTRRHSGALGKGSLELARAGGSEDGSHSISVFLRLWSHFDGFDRERHLATENETGMVLVEMAISNDGNEPLSLSRRARLDGEAGLWKVYHEPVGRAQQEPAGLGFPVEMQRDDRARGVALQLQARGAQGIGAARRLDHQ